MLGNEFIKSTTDGNSDLHVVNNNKEYAMRKRMIIMIIALVIVFGSIFGWDALRAHFMKQYFANFQPPPTTVSATKAQSGAWQPTISAVGTMAAINGVNVTTQIGGMITTINFSSGQMVNQNQLLIQLDDSVDVANLQKAQAQLELNKLTYERYKVLLKKAVISVENYDQSLSNYQQSVANVASIQANINYKHITAPFTGKIGIRLVNLGQYVSPGTALVSLQSMDPLFVNFSVPEQNLHYLKLGQTLEIKVDNQPGKVFTGKLTAINSTVDTTTHNISIQGTVPNPQQLLYPGLFANINVLLPPQPNVVTIPQTAIAYSLFGNSVFLIKKDGKDKSGKDILRVTRAFVTTGDQYNNKVVITKGLKAGDMVVTSGQLKLDNNTQVVVNNVIQP